MIDESVKWMLIVQKIALVVMKRNPEKRFLGYGVICDGGGIFDPLENVGDLFDLIKKLGDSGHMVCMDYFKGTWHVRINDDDRCYFHYEDVELYPHESIVELSGLLAEHKQGPWINKAESLNA